jgi:hypothetical protein
MKNTIEAVLKESVVYGKQPTISILFVNFPTPAGDPDMWWIWKDKVIDRITVLHTIFIFLFFETNGVYSNLRNKQHSEPRTFGPGEKEFTQFFGLAYPGLVFLFIRRVCDYL